jgi:hypothetical protein
MLHFAVFGDIHGRVALMITMAKLWEQHTGLRLAGILQVGDMGAFPDHTRLDDATARMARDDPDELGFAAYCAPSEEGERYLGGASVPVTAFIRGNHEDFDYLAQFSAPEAVDPWQRLWYVPDGAVFELEREGRVIRVAGFGGIPPRDEAPRRGKKGRHESAHSGSRGESDPRCFSVDDAALAFSGEAPIDVLLTHAGPAHPDFPEGSERLAALSRRLAPRVHLFGHHHVALGPTEGPGGGLLVGLDHLEFGRRGELREACAGVLTLDGERTSFDLFEPASHPWLAGVRRDTYRSLLPASPGA